jgi:hypothetical protein
LQNLARRAFAEILALMHSKDREFKRWMGSSCLACCGDWKSTAHGGRVRSIGDAGAIKGKKSLIDNSMLVREQINPFRVDSAKAGLELSTLNKSVFSDPARS